MKNAFKDYLESIKVTNPNQPEVEDHIFEITGELVDEFNREQTKKNANESIETPDDYSDPLDAVDLDDDDARSVDDDSDQR